MPNLSPLEIIAILVVVVLLFGAKKLPELAKSIGQSMKIFRKETQDEPDQPVRSSSDATMQTTGGGPADAQHPSVAPTPVVVTKPSVDSTL